MAVWQFALLPLPNAMVRTGNVHLLRVEIGDDEAPRDHFDKLDIDELALSFSQILSEKPSWSPELRIWGEEGFSDIQVWLERRKIESVKVRLDLRTLSMSLVDGLCRLATERDWSFVTTTGEVVPPSRAAVVRAAIASSAHRFIRDPQSFLDEAVRMDGDA